MYRRTTAKVTYVSEDMSTIKIRLKRSWRNKNYVNTIFGGSMFAAVDPIPMTQLINLLGEDYVVWDKSAEIKFKIPAKETLYATFHFSNEEIELMKSKVEAENEFEYVKQTNLTNKNGDKVFCEVHKNIYIAEKDFFKEKRQLKKEKRAKMD